MRWFAEPGTGSRGPLLSLQVLRFVAAAMVVVHHVGYDADQLAARTGRQPLALDTLFDGTFGVHLFFVLSGFIIVYAERDFGRPGAARRFVLRRLIRVVPLYWLLTTVLLVGGATAPRLLNTPVEGWRNILASYLFVPVMRAAGDSHPVLGQGWTLNYEMVFYTVFAAAMMVPRTLGLLTVALVLCGLAAIGRWVAPSGAALQVWTDPLLLEFLFGAGIALVRATGFALGRATSLMLAGTGLACAAAAGPAIAAAGGPSWALDGGAAALVLGGLALGPPWPPTRPVLVASVLGDASYSLYLSHPFVVRPVRELWWMVVPDWPIVAYVLTACVTATAVALLLHAVVERPLTRVLRRWSSAGMTLREQAEPEAAVLGRAHEPHCPAPSPTASRGGSGSEKPMSGRE